MASDMTTDASGKFAVTDAAAVEITLNPSGVYGIHNVVGDVCYFSTNGETPELSTATKAGHGIIQDVSTVFGEAVILSGVSTLKFLNDTGETSKIVITRRGFVPAWER
jgi:hypothetical protein